MFLKLNILSMGAEDRTDERDCRKTKRVHRKGEVKQGDVLKQLFQGTDRSLYKAIYSFDVFGLQEIHAFNRTR